MSNHNKETEARCFHCYRHYVEGTAAWALYMMRMGHEITNPMYDPRIYHLPEGGIIHVNGVETIAASEWIDYWCIDIPDGWHLYEPKPLLADAKVGDLCQTRGEGYHLISDVYTDQRKYAYERNCGDTIYVCENGMFNLINHEHPFDIIHTEPIASEGSAEWAWQMLKLGKPVTNKRVFIGGYIKATCSDKYHFVQMWDYSGWQLYEPKPETAKEQFAVGDWVEFNPGNNPHQVRIVKVDGEKLHYIDEKGYQTHIYISTITRKLDPSEVIVKIGCLSGTVAPGCIDATIMIVPIGYNGFGDVAIIPVAMLDAPTRELVKALLKAQEGE